MIQRHLADGLQDPQLVAHVVPFAGEIDPRHPIPPGQGHHGVCQLDFPARSGLGPVEDVENLRREHAPAENGKQGEDLVGRRLFHHVGDAVEVVPQGIDFQGAVPDNLFGGDLLDADDTEAILFICPAELAAGGILADDDVVAVQYGERLIPYKSPGPADRVTQSPRLL